MKAILLTAAVLFTQASGLRSADWPGFRGDGTSVSTAQRLPVHWSSTSNLVWSISLTGAGQSSPIVWRDRVFVTSAVGPRKEQLIVQALSVVTGRELWRFSTNSCRAQDVSNMHSQAAPTPVAAEDGVFACFESGDVLALKHDGSVRWHHQLSKTTGEDTGNHGLGGSPILWGGGLFIPLDQQGLACLLSLDRATGGMRWKAARPDRVGWSTPTVARRGDDWQIIASGSGTAAGYNPDTGALRWEVSGILKNTIPSPTVAGSLLIIGSGSKGSNLALDLAGGTNAPIQVWRSTDATCGFASPLIHRGRVYFLSKAGVLTCLEAKTGRTLFEERAGDGGWASPIGAGDRIYVFGEKTTTLVIAATDEFRPLATNHFAFSQTICGVAATDGALILRGYDQLVCFGNPGAQLKRSE